MVARLPLAERHPWSAPLRMVRLQKFLAEAGVASRRASEEIIRAGRVEVNGRRVQELGLKVDPDQDRVAVDGRLLRPKRKLYVALNKPAGYVSTRSDPQGRKTILDLLPAEWRELYPVGRLDRESEGLILLTNDGELCLRATHPRFGVRKIYQVTIEGRVESATMRRFTEGITHVGERLRADRAGIRSANNSTSVVELELHGGRNREVRRMCEALDLPVLRLQRVQIGPIKLGELPVGKWRILGNPEVRSLLAGGAGAAAASDNSRRPGGAGAEGRHRSPRSTSGPSPE